MPPSQAHLCAVLAIVVVVMMAPKSTMALTCNAMELSPCGIAIITTALPSETCCSKLKEQRPCLCQFLRDPNLQKLVNSPNARKVANICGSPFPSCYKSTPRA